MTETAATEIARATIETEIAGLQALAGSIDGRFTQAVELIHGCKGRVIITGIGKSGHIGQKIAATLASTGTPAFFVHAAEASHGDLGMIGGGDIVVAISNSGESTELRAIVEYCRRHAEDVRLIAITAKPNSALGRLSNLVLQLPEAAEACPLSLSPMTSTTMTLVLGDALAAALIRKRDFKSQDFARFHPAGKLGAQLIKLSELVARTPSIADVPQVPEDADMPRVIMEISRGRRGVTGVTDKAGAVVGVITDGDLRRALADRAIFDRHAGDIMSRKPKMIAGDRIAVDALAMCEEHRISSLFVTGPDGNVVGLIHLQDLLALGIA
ncbi:MAG: SIS domain-containing protein [Rhizobiaceae bacterium]